MITRTIANRLGEATLIQGATGELLATEGTEVVATTVAVDLTTISRILALLTTTAMVVATGCKTATFTRAMKAEATTTDRVKVRGSTKALVKLEHLVELLSPQVMVDQERRRLMTSSTIETINKSVNFQPSLLRMSTLRSDFDECLVQQAKF